MNPEGMVGLLDYREDGITPYMLFFKDGLLVEKCVSTQLSLQKHKCHEAACNAAVKKTFPRHIKHFDVSQQEKLRRTISLI